MKKFKHTLIKAVSVMLTVILISVSIPFTASAVSSSTPPAYVTSSKAKALWAEGTTATTTNNIDAVKWYEKEGKYYWFLPSSADLSSLTVYHNFSNVKINGTNILSGNSYNIFKNGQTYTVTADNKSYTLCVQQASKIGSIFLTTESGSMNEINSDKEHKEKGDLVAIDYDGSVSYDNKLSSIKGRGNTTWKLPKKPYNIKLDKKASLLGMDKNKNWCLLANAQDHSMIRNVLMYDLAHEAGLDFSPESRFVDVYANGEYQGTYQLSQKIEAGEGDLVDIVDLEGNTEDAVAAGTGIDDVDLEELYGNNKYRSNNRNGFNIPYNPSDITGGYLMEFVVGIDEPSSFTTKGGQIVNMKAPEYCSAQQINYIADFMQDLENALYSSTGYNSKGKHYTDYLDIKSAAIMYLLQELSVNIDGGISSCYFYKDSDLNGDGKVHASPCWDFDVSLGNLTNEKDGVKMTSNDKWFIKNSYRYSNTRTVFSQLCQHDDFMAEVEKIWREKFVPALDIAMGKADGNHRLQSIYDYDALLEASTEMNYIRWDLRETLLVSGSGLTQDAQLTYLEKFLKGRISFLNSGFLDLEGAKAEAIKTIDSIIADYKNEYPADVVAQMTTVANKAKTDINNATTNAKVITLLEKAIQDIDACKVTTVYYDNSETQWNNVYFYSWSGAVTTDWPGEKMTDLGDNIFKFSYKGELSNIIFSNGESEETGNKRQTYNLTFQGNNTIYKANTNEDEYDNDKEAYMHQGNWSSYSPTPNINYGDVDNNNNIELLDVIYIQKNILGLYKLDSNAKLRADVDQDNEITLIDAVYIQKFLLGTVTSFPIN
ncbi:MAG: CotH kinase family protein [Acutalibacteraceae bacterium]|nr:CotH kinase family protein [Acutalibacteraceae bacterium]